MIAIFNNVKGSIGLDIGSGSIKVVGLKKGKGGIELTGALLVELPPTFIGEKAGKRKKTGETLKKALGEIETLKGKTISIATPGPSVYIRYVKLPPVDTARVAQIVNYEAQQQIPLPLEEVIWDYQVLKKEAVGTNVVLVAAKSELINDLLEEVGAFRIEPEVVDYSPLAFYNCLNFNQELSPEEISVLLDVGAKSTDMSIEREGTLCWTRNIPIGGHDITRAIEQSFGLSFGEAEKLKREEIIDLGNEGEKISQAVTPVLFRLVKDIERSLTFFQAESGGGATVNRLLLSGGGANLTNLDKFLERELKVKVEKASPLKNIRLPNGFPFPGQENYFTVAVGLALRPLIKCASEISLLPPDIAKKKEFQKRKGDLAFSFLLAILIAGTAYAFAVQDYNLQKHRQEAIKSELARYEKYEQPIKIIREEIKTIIEKLEALRGLAREKDLWLEVLLELSRLVPDEVKLNSFSREEGILTLGGEAPNISVVSALLFRLESSPLFGKIEVGTPVRIRGEEEFYRFSLKIHHFPSSATSGREGGRKE